MNKKLCVVCSAVLAPIVFGAFVLFMCGVHIGVGWLFQNIEYAGEAIAIIIGLAMVIGIYFLLYEHCVEYWEKKSIEHSDE